MTKVQYFEKHISYNGCSFGIEILGINYKKRVKILPPT